MYGLIMDTSGPLALLALTKGTEVVATSTLDGGRGLSGRLFVELERLAGPQIKNLSYIAVGVGPGSFAGTRTAVTIAKTLGFATSTQVIGFPSPMAFIPSPIEEGPFAFLLDAKMGQLALLTGELPSFETTTTIFKAEAIDDHLPKNCPLITDLELPKEAFRAEANPAPVAKWAAGNSDAGALNIAYLQSID
jgi:tRNA threonylcarbamoyl adenosine modification protein YeaZ